MTIAAHSEPTSEPLGEAPSGESRKKSMMDALDRIAGRPAVGDLLWGRQRLTALVYHRVVPDDDPDVYDPDVVSATPAAFGQQMRYLARNFSVIGLDDLAAHIHDQRPLPPRPAIVTFDDGYRDNHQHALPVLRELGLPSVVFITTDFVGDDVIPWWDALADLCRRAPRGRTELPLVGRVEFDGVDGDRAVRTRLLAALKDLPDDAREAAMKAIADAIGVQVREPRERLFMTWDQAADAAQAGMVCQPHTVSHPILTNVPAARARDEVSQSALTVAQHTGCRPVAFAYPNGSHDPSVVDACREQGISIGFTMDLGPARNVRRSPLTIPRVSVRRVDSPAQFRLKTQGVTSRVLAARDVAGRLRDRGRTAA